MPNESSSNNLSNLNFETTIADSNNLNTKSIPPFPTKRSFKLASLNIASLIKHIDELRILLVNYPVDILSINETKLDNSINDCEIHRPPNSPVELFTSFESLIERLDAENVEFYLMGDFNCNLANDSTQYDNNTHLLSSITDTYGLQQLINEHTRITKTTSTLIDLIYTNYPDRVVCSGVSHCGISDHSLIYVYRKLSLNTVSSKGNNYVYRNFKKFNLENFRSDISSQDWNYNLSNIQDPNPNLMWAEWKSKFLNIADKHAPIRTKRIRSKNSP